MEADKRFQNLRPDANYKSLLKVSRPLTLLVLAGTSNFFGCLSLKNHSYGLNTADGVEVWEAEIKRNEALKGTTEDISGTNRITYHVTQCICYVCKGWLKPEHSSGYIILKEGGGMCLCICQCFCSNGGFPGIHLLN